MRSLLLFSTFRLFGLKADKQFFDGRLDALTIVQFTYHDSNPSDYTHQLSNYQRFTNFYIKVMCQMFSHYGKISAVNYDFETSTSTYTMPVNLN